MRTARLLALLALLGLLSLCLLFRLVGERREREEARHLVADALAGGKSPERQMELFRRARTAAPNYGVAPCEQGVAQEQRMRYKEAAASFQSCSDGDPKQAYALLGYARSLLRARGSESYVEVRSALRRFLEMAPDDPVASHDTANRRSAEGMVLDLEELLRGKGVDLAARQYSGEEIRRILLKIPVRGSSRYDGPRVPLRLGFIPGDASLSTAAEEQLREVARALRDGSLAGASIQIEGHTDSVEGKTHRARVEISVRRAEAAKRFLVRQGGVPADHLSVTGLADDYPLQPNGTAKGSAANRRVELVNRTTQDPVQRDVRDPFGS